MLKLVSHNPSPKKAVKASSGERRFEVDYAGAWKGHCKTRESAVNAACKRITTDNYSKATVTDKHTGDTVARLRLSDDRKKVIIEFIKPLKKYR